jgi:hypothetical protein
MGWVEAALAFVFEFEFSVTARYAFSRLEDKKKEIPGRTIGEVSSISVLIDADATIVR